VPIASRASAVRLSDRKEHLHPQILRFTNMSARCPFCRIRIALFDGIQDGAVLDVSGFAASSDGEGGAVEQCKRLAKIVERLHHVSIVRCIANRAMKAAVDDCESIRIPGVAELAKKVAHVSHFSRCRLLSSKPCRRTLQQLSHCV